MDANQRTFWKKYIANVQLDLSIAAYTKVPVSWNEYDYIPDFNKMYYIVEGEGYLKVGEREFYPQPGELYLLPAGVIQSYGTISPNTFGKYWCHFTAKIGDLHLFQIVKTPARVKIAGDTDLKGKFEQLIHHLHSDEFTSEFRVKSILLEIIALFIERCERIQLNMAAASSFEKMSTVLKYIEERLSDNITVDELAQIAHFHPNYFIHVFKGFTGYSPIQYVNRTRLEKAKHLLAFSNCSVSAIADAVGMDLPYFSRTFKEYTGFSPTAYRELVPKSN